ncbi:hypothetical protein [Streptomyces sp. RB17]|uniref:hypothetical protein n=1 Tax=Streptomyces sp. RB17 TaxID=2585197 RepID=UPI0012979BB8
MVQDPFAQQVLDVVEEGEHLSGYFARFAALDPFAADDLDDRAVDPVDLNDRQVMAFMKAA